MTFTVQGPLLLAGAGKMGGAILAGLLARGLDARSVIVQDPDPAGPVADLLADNGIDVLPFIDELTQPPGLILVAVKPQVMDTVLPPLAKLAGPQTLLVSIAAGRTIASFEKHFARRCHRARHAEHAGRDRARYHRRCRQSQRDAGAAGAGRRSAVGGRRCRVGRR